MLKKLLIIGLLCLQATFSGCVQQEEIIDSVRQGVSSALHQQTQDTLKHINAPLYAVSEDARSFKCYASYTALSKSSKQWRLIQCHPNTYTDQNGMRKVDDYYCVAMGSYYSQTLGDIFQIVTENNSSFKVIICDFKSDKHTDKKHMYSVSNGCMLEFYVDIDKLPRYPKIRGDISYVNKKFEGKIISVIKLGNYFDF